MIEIDDYIKKQNSPQKEILIELRRIILSTLPKTNEEIKGGVPCYGVSKENPYGLCYIVGLKDHVNIGFLINKLSNEDIKLLTGSGKTMKTLEITSLQGMNKKLITRLLESLKK